MDVPAAEPADTNPRPPFPVPVFSTSDIAGLAQAQTCALPANLPAGATYARSQRDMYGCNNGHLSCELKLQPAGGGYDLGAGKSATCSAPGGQFLLVVRAESKPRGSLYEVVSLSLGDLSAKLSIKMTKVSTHLPDGLFAWEAF